MAKRDQNIIPAGTGSRGKLRPLSAPDPPACPEDRDSGRDYRGSAYAIGGLALAGFVLQFLFGYLDLPLFRAPVNLMFGAVILLGIAACASFPASRFVRRISGVPFAVANLSALLILCLWMGLIPQGDPPDGQPDLLYLFGLRHVTVSWPFALLYLSLLFSLGVLSARRLLRFRRSDYAFFVNHLGLWLILFAAGFGAADLTRYRIQVFEGTAEQTGVPRDPRRHDPHPQALPFAVHLKDFDMEEYPPKLHLADPRTGKYQPEGKPASWQIDPREPTGQLLDWEITLKTYIENAVRDQSGAFKEVRMPGASPAAELGVRHRVSGREYTGWAFRGNSMQSASIIPLEGGLWLVMGQPEAKRYLSDVRVIPMRGDPVEARIEVNKPLRIGPWTIYQQGYDTDAGRMSRYSILEAVYDPWLHVVYAGIALVALGSVFLFWSGRNRKRREDGME